MCIVRTCRYSPFSVKPLVMVLAQVRFSPLANIASYIPAIQDSFRRKGYPHLIAVEGKNYHLNSDGVREESVQKWRIDSVDRHSNILLDSGQMMLQTTSYSRFEVFCARWLDLYNDFCTLTAHNSFGIVQTLGLRYINQVEVMEDSESWKDYLKPSFHGLHLGEAVQNVLHATATRADTRLPHTQAPGTLMVRMAQNNDGQRIPPDLVDFAPDTSTTSKGDLITLIDLDHVLVEELAPPVSSSAIEERFFALHDVIIETLHLSVLSEKAVKSWE